MKPKRINLAYYNDEWNVPDVSNEKCLHDDCPECEGTGRKDNGEMCAHYISCPCSKCNPKF